MLKIKDLNVSIGDREILNNFSLDIEDGSIVALMGPNGIGKSTICKVIMGDTNYSVNKGSITYNDEDLLKMDTVTRSRKGIYLVNQNPIEIEGVSNAEMLRSALEERTGEHISFFQFNKEITELCKKLDIPTSFIHRGINEGMSGGEKKKNELLHLYMLKPNLVLLDELDSGLDVDSLKTIATNLKEYINPKVSMLIITHHTSILEYLKPDKVCVMKDGTIVKEGDASLADYIENNGFNLDVSE